MLSVKNLIHNLAGGFDRSRDGHQNIRNMESDVEIQGNILKRKPELEQDKLLKGKQTSAADQVKKFIKCFCNVIWEVNNHFFLLMEIPDRPNSVPLFCNTNLFWRSPVMDGFVNRTVGYKLLPPFCHCNIWSKHMNLYVVQNTTDHE